MTKGLLEIMFLNPDAKVELLDLLKGVEEIAFKIRDNRTSFEAQMLIEKIESM